MTTSITDFYPGTTKRIQLTLSLEGVPQDITSDSVTWRIKRYSTDTDAESLLSVAADVTTYGVSGIARLEAFPADTNDLESGRYWTDIVWLLSGGDEYVVVSQKIRILERVSDA